MKGDFKYSTTAEDNVVDEGKRFGAFVIKVAIPGWYNTILIAFTSSKEKVDFKPVEATRPEHFLGAIPKELRFAWKIQALQDGSDHRHIGNESDQLSLSHTERGGRSPRRGRRRDHNPDRLNQGCRSGQRWPSTGDPRRGARAESRSNQPLLCRSHGSYHHQQPLGTPALDRRFCS